MSLTAFVGRDTVARTLTRHFPTPEASLSEPLRRPWRSSNYGLVGTAYDYLLRFYLSRTIPITHTRPWVAETGVRMLTEGPFGTETLAQTAREVLEEARQRRDEYVTSGVLEDRLIELSIDLARIDGVYRRMDVPDEFGDYDPEDVADLRGLVTLLDERTPLVGEEAYLNPAFGTASSVVGGADADVILDGTLIDIKATKKGRLEGSWWHQLVGYAILADVQRTMAQRREELSEDVDAEPLPAVSDLGIYFARHGVLWTVSAEYVYEYADYEEVRAWFVDAALGRRSTAARPAVREMFCEPFDYSVIPNQETRRRPPSSSGDGQSTLDEFSG